MSGIAPTAKPTAAASQISCRPPDNARHDLKIEDIMSRDMITASMTDTVFSAARKMSEHNVSCIVVVDDEMVLGILTDKDMLKDLADHDRDFDRLQVEARMSSPVEVVSPQTSVVAAGQIMETHGIKRLPVVDAGRLVGIVTQTDITRGLISISPLKAVADIMTTEVATVDTAATVAEAAQIMATRGISSLIATHRDEVSGIVTEKDLLRRVVALHKDPIQTQVVDVMSFPMISVPPRYSVISAAKKMDVMHLHRLVVMEDNQIYGIITQTDITRAIRIEFEKLRQKRQAFDTELSNLIQNTVADLQQFQLFLNEASGYAQLSATSHPFPTAVRPDDNN